MAGVILDSLLNTTAGMTAVRNNVKNDDNTDTVAGVDWFTYAGRVCNTIYVSGNNWIGFGVSSEQLKICRRDGAVYYVYRQEGILTGGTRFLKIRTEGYTSYSSTSTAYKLVYEVFLFDDGCLYINVVQTPTTSSHIGTSSITDGTNTATLNIPAGITSAAPVEIVVEKAGSAQEIYYERYPRFVPVRIEVTEMPAKTVYYGNELFDSAGLIISAVDIKGNKKAVTDYTLSGFDSSTSGSKTITVTANELSAQFEITVSEISITGIEVTKLPDKVDYIPNSIFNPAGMEVAFVLSDGNKIAADRYTIGSFDSTESGQKNITVTYSDFTTDFSVTVLTPVSIEITQPPSKTSYIRNDEIKTEGMIVSEIYPNGEKREVTGYTVSPLVTAAEYGTSTITVTWKGLAATYTVEVSRYTSVQIGSPNLADVVATLDSETGLLTISGTGAIKDFDSFVNDDTGMWPPYLEGYGHLIKNIIIEDGITKLGSLTLVGFVGAAESGLQFNLESVTLPSTLTELSAGAIGFLFVKGELRIPDGINLAELFTYSSIADVCFINKIVIDQDYRDFPTLRLIGCCIYRDTLYDPESGVSFVEENGGLSVIGTTCDFDNPVNDIKIPSSYKGKPVINIKSTIFIMCFSNNVYLHVPSSVESIENNAFALLDYGTAASYRISVDKIEDSIPGSGWGVSSSNIEWTIPKALTGIRITALPNRLQYGKGDQLDTLGLVVTGDYNNGTSQSIYDYTVSALDSSTYGTKTITVECEGFTASFTVEVVRMITTNIGSPTLEDVVAEYDTETGILSIRGKGNTKDFTASGGTSGYPYSELMNPYRLDIKKIIVEDAVTRLGHLIFAGMENVVDMQLGSGITAIGDYAFAGLINLTELAIPESVQNFGNYLFDKCSKLERVTVGGPGTVLPDGIFSQCAVREFHFRGETLGSIGYMRSTLEELYLGAHVKALDSSSTVQSYPKLRKIVIEGPVKVIPDSYAAYCPALEEVVLPDALTKIGTLAFSETALKTVHLPEGLIEIGDNAFSRIKSLVSLVLPESLVTVGGSTFYGCTSLEHVTAGGPGFVVASGLFSSSPITDIYIRGGEIRENAFSSASSLSAVRLGVVKLGSRAFSSCSALTTLTLDVGLTAIPGWCFQDCSALARVDIPDSVITMGNGAFQNCTALAEVTLPSGLTAVPDQAFLGCGFTNFRIEDNLKITAIGSVAFLNNQKLESVYIGSSVTDIKSDAFASCPKLTDITINKRKDSIPGAPWGVWGDVKVTWLVKTEKIQVSPPAKTEYAPGDDLDTAGMEVTAVYSDGSSDAVTDYTVSGFDSTKTGQQAVTITYTDGDTVLTDQFYVFVGAVLPTGIVVTRYPDKRVYALGEVFDSTNLAVSIIYNSGKTELVTDYALSGYDSDTVGIKTINVAYTPPAVDGQVTDILQTTFAVTVTKYGRNPFESDTTRKGMRIHWLDRPYTDVTSEEIQLDSFSLDQSICTDSSFRFGGCISSKFECKIFSDQFLDPDTYPDGKIQVYLQAGDEEVRVFTGVIDTADRTDSLNIRRIVAYDELKTKGGINLKEFGAYVSKFSPGVSLLRKELLKYLGIEEIRTNLMYDAAMIPFGFDYSSLTALQLIKDICVNNMVWGWINPDGVFEYIKLPPNAYWRDGKHNYYTPEEVLTGLIKPTTFKEGRIWYPYRFALNPDPYYPVDVGVEIPDPVAYEDNVYFIDNSPLVGDYDWISQVYKEKTTYDASSGFGSTTYELAGPIVLGPHFEQDDYSHRYLAREYTCKVKGNPYRKIGSNIQFEVKKQLLDGRELTWTINSYIMSRKMTSADGLFIDTYSARNGPYNPPAYGVKKDARSNTMDLGRIKKTMPRWKVYDGSGQSTEITVETGNLQGAYVMQADQYNADNYQQGVIYYLYEE